MSMWAIQVSAIATIIQGNTHTTTIVEENLLCSSRGNIQRQGLGNSGKCVNEHSTLPTRKVNLQQKNNLGR